MAAGSFLLAGCSGGDSATPTGQPTVPGGTADTVRTTDDRTTDGGDTAELDSERPSAVVGQRIVDESVGFLVEGVGRRSQLAGRGEAPSGQEYLIVVLSVKNRGDDALEMGDLTDFRLTDGGGTTRERLRLVSQTGSQFDGGYSFRARRFAGSSPSRWRPTARTGRSSSTWTPSRPTSSG